MSEEEKQARRSVRDYLSALEANKPKRGRKRTPESIEKRLTAIDQELDAASPLKRLELAQERLNLQAEREQLNESVDMTQLEAEFIKFGKEYGANKGISYSAWRDVGVPAAVLRSAGISRAD